MTGKEWRHIACALYAGGKHHAAIAAFLRAKCLGEDEAEFHREFAVTLWAAGDRDTAMAEMSRAHDRDKNSFPIAATMSNFLAALGEYEGAAKWLKHAISIDGTDHQARFNRALYLLTSGDWENGWKEYETRFDLFPMDFPAPSGVRLWRNNVSIDGKLIWVQGEQGVGDQIQFSRYIPWLQAQGASVILDCNSGIADFAAKADIITRHMDYAGKYTVPRHPVTQALPDYYIPLLSLPARHKTTQSNVPSSPNWFKKAAQAFDFPVRGKEGKKKIGLAWAGSKDHPGDHLRSMTLQQLLPLTGDDACEFYNFQVGPRAADIMECGAEPLINGLPIRMWMQTAVALRQMDALVTVDTGCAHLAGALGVKTFLMVSTEPDWRWGTAGEATPWYPSFKIIRQATRGDWVGVVRRVADEIAKL